MTPPGGSHTIVNMKVDYRIRSQNVWEEAKGLGGAVETFPPRIGGLWMIDLNITNSRR